MTPAKRVWFGLVFAAAFGVAAGLFKGNDPGLRGGIGNLSAPWLLVALFPALHCRSVMRGALLGLASTLVALAGFYTALTAVLAGQLGGGGHLTELFVEVVPARRGGGGGCRRFWGGGCGCGRVWPPRKSPAGWV